jgi:hypothetical protein
MLGHPRAAGSAVVRDLPAALARVLGSEARRVVGRPSRSAPELVFRSGGTTYVIEVKPRGDLLSAQAAAFQLSRHAAHGRRVRLVVVPLMGQRSAAFLADHGISWLDLAGNADITAPGLRVRIMGKAGAPRTLGRPADPFAPRRARISHLLLLFPARRWRQQELADASGLDRGYVSRTIEVLVQAGLVQRHAGGEVGPRDPRLYFEAWRDAYRFSRHRIIAGHVGARSGEELAIRLARHAEAASLDFALTALPAAFFLTRFGGFRLVTAFLAAEPDQAWLNELRFRPEPQGANLWLVIPKDEGVMLGTQVAQGIRCVSGVQASLDLKDHPERSDEADAAIRQRLMPWIVVTGEAPARV